MNRHISRNAYLLASSFFVQRRKSPERESDRPALSFFIYYVRSPETLPCDLLSSLCDP